MKNLLKLTIFVALITVSRTDYDRNCGNGQCTPIRNCSYIQEYLRKDNKIFLKNLTTICGFQDKVPLICCAPIKVDQIQFVNTENPATLRPAASTTHVPIADNTFVYTSTTTSPHTIRTPEILNNSSSLINNNDNLVEEKFAANKLPGRDICGIQTSDEIFDRIVGGDLTKLSEFPWMARIKYSRPNNADAYLCAGTLISDQYVVTAAHCLESKTFKIIGVRLGDWNDETEIDCDVERRCSDPPVDVAIEKTISHANFSKINYHSDIALLKLSQPVTFTEFVRPICLPNTEHVANVSNEESSNYWAAGWGRTEYDYISPVKRKVLLNQAPVELCKPLLGRSTDSVLPWVICAGGRKGADSCTGDSGGPLMQIAREGENMNWFLYGIISLGKNPCGTEGQPAVYTRITYYLDWINANIE